MYATFKTLQEYEQKNEEVNLLRGYPDGEGTQAYSTTTPKKTISGEYAMWISPSVAKLFVNCTITDLVEYPEEIQE